MTGILVRWADGEDLQDVAGVLRHAATWLESRGETLWTPEQVEPDALRADVFAGRWVVAQADRVCVGVARVTDHDVETWPEAVPGEALYLHRLAVLRSHAAGIVTRPLLSWCCHQARISDIPLLRLDCDVRRPRLREVYASLGFRFHSVIAVGPHTVARFELSSGLTHA